MAKKKKTASVAAASEIELVPAVASPKIGRPYSATARRRSKTMRVDDEVHAYLSEVGMTWIVDSIMVSPEFKKWKRRHKRQSAKR